jgi:hypothetical protein
VVDPATDLQGNRAIAFTGNNDTAATRSLATTVSSDVFIDFMIQFNGTLSSNDFLGLFFGSNPGNSTTQPNIGLKGNLGAGGTDIFVRTNGTGGSFLSGSNISTGITYRIVGHLFKTNNSTNYNQFDAWIDPTNTELSSLTGIDASFTGASGISSFNKIGFRTANLAAGDTVLIDNITISTTAPVPEPGTMMLLGIGMAGLAFCGMRRKNSKS